MVSRRYSELGGGGGLIIIMLLLFSEEEDGDKKDAMRVFEAVDNIIGVVVVLVGCLIAELRYRWKL